MVCNQLCHWNDSSDGCIKPIYGICPMSNMASQGKPQTNADRIRAMSDEDLEDFLLTEEWMCDTYISCSECPLRGEKGCISILEWLKQPAEVDHG